MVKRKLRQFGSVRSLADVKSRAHLFYGGGALLDVFGSTAPKPTAGSAERDADAINRDLWVVGNDLRSVIQSQR